MLFGLISTLINLTPTTTSTRCSSRRRHGGEETKRPKRRVWRRLGPRCVFLLFNFSVLLTRTAPNDASGVVWAVSFVTMSAGCTTPATPLIGPDEAHECRQE